MAVAYPAADADMREEISISDVSTQDLVEELKHRADLDMGELMEVMKDRIPNVPTDATPAATRGLKGSISQ